MLRHRYGDHYLHNEPLAISFRGLELSEDLLLIVLASSRPSPVSTCGTDRKASQLTDVSMYRLAKVEVASLYPRIQEGAPNRGYRSCFKTTDCLWTMTDRYDCRFVSLCPLAVHRGLYPFKKRKIAICEWPGRMRRKVLHHK
ncbi:hypothetical protein T4C_3986 [Trichinella pseudospiralis]|uniref:Uncharacterized protein n=1 Tax=Trichinella pseudospiralis TaxID=6337 RepID=A0A0V1JZ22_TRIPS|nr:hypothetical protein T4C_3986 [Trichinella pseudospiralis]